MSGSGSGSHRGGGHHRMHLGMWAYGIFLIARHAGKHHHRKYKLARQRAHADRMARLDYTQNMQVAAIASWVGRIAAIIFILYLAHTMGMMTG